MPKQNTSAQLKIKVEGSPLTNWIQQSLADWEVIDNRRSPDAFQLRFSDQFFKVLDGTELKVGSKVELAVQTAGSGGPETLLVGEIAAIELDYTDRKVFAVVRGFDASHRLYRGRRTESYEGRQVPQIVEKVAERAGLSVGDSGNIPAGSEKDVVNQTAESDAAFLDRLAHAVGARWWVVKRELFFKPLAPPSDAPSPSTPPAQDDLVIDPAHGLVSLLASTSAVGQVKEVQVPGWDPVRKQAVLGKAEIEHPSVEIDAGSPSDLAGSFGTDAPALVYNGVICTSQEEADTVAASVASQVASGYAELDGTCVGNPKLRADTAVTVGATVKPFAGKYLITSTRHFQNGSGTYLTDFIASGWADRSLHGLVAQAAPQAPPATNLMVGVVKNIDDAEGLGRVRVNLPTIGENHKSGWLPVLYPGAGKTTGMIAPLAVGAQVLVAVPSNDPDAAVVLGGLHNQQDTLPTLPGGVEYHDVNTGEVQGFCITAPGGAQLAFVNESSSGTKLVKLATGDGNHTVELDQKEKTVTIKTTGKIMISGTQGITIDAGQSSLELKGSSIKLDGQTIEISGSSVQVKGDSVQVG